jgi:hypothetical protein
LCLASSATLVTEVAESVAGEEIIIRIAEHRSGASLSRYPHVRIEAEDLAPRRDRRASAQPREAEEGNGPHQAAVVSQLLALQYAQRQGTVATTKGNTPKSPAFELLLIDPLDVLGKVTPGYSAMRASDRLAAPRSENSSKERGCGVDPYGDRLATMHTQ